MSRTGGVVAEKQPIVSRQSPCRSASGYPFVHFVDISLFHKGPYFPLVANAVRSDPKIKPVRFRQMAALQRTHSAIGVTRVTRGQTF